MRSAAARSVSCAVLLALLARPAEGQLWRNGSFDGFGGLFSTRAGFDARVYDNFMVTGTGWQITALYGEFLIDFVPETAYWEIRSGITTGQGGTLLYSFTSA